MKSLFTTATLRSTLAKLARKSSGDYMNPSRDWLIGLAIATLIGAGGVTLIVIDFYTQFVVPVDATSEEIQPVTYRENEVRYYSKLYTERESTFNELRRDKQFVPPLIIEEAASSTLEGEKDEVLAEDAQAQ